MNNKLFDVKRSDVPIDNLLTSRFVAPPFTVLDSRAGYWSKRKKEWKTKCGLQSELGRGDFIIDENGEYVPNSSKKANCYRVYEEKYGRNFTSATSIFDPVLCELVYRWFTPKLQSTDSEISIIDPFAGGSVRGIVASALNMQYTGIDLRPEQIYANNLQFNSMQSSNDNSKFTLKPTWICGDSLNILDLVNETYDLLFTCPPYFDLEVYSDLDNDLSNLNSYDDFLNKYNIIISNTCKLLKDNSFAVIVVSDIRDKQGTYRNFVSDTISAFTSCGLKYYNECIYISPIGTLPFRAPKMFNSNRKLGKAHQNMLVFYKGDVKQIKDKFGEVVSPDLQTI